MIGQLAERLLALRPTKRMKIFNSVLLSPLPYYLSVVAILISYFTICSNPCIYFLIFYSIMIVVDEIFAEDWKNPKEKELKQLKKNNFWFQLPLFLQVLFTWLVLFKVLKYVENFDASFWNFFNLFMMILAHSSLEAGQFLVSHEIFHKPGRLYKILGTIHMIKNHYMHFSYQHMYGHHRRVATPQDPASAPKSMTVFEFFPRSFFGGYKSVYLMERQLKKPFYLNCAVLSVVTSIAISICVYKFYGFKAFAYFSLISHMSIFYLEVINYVEHYGLRRKKNADGEYEKVTIKHSWNAAYRFSNYFMYKLQRHSDHHENSSKPYQELLSLEESPQLPHGYTCILMLALTPSLWFEVMDPMIGLEESGKSKQQIAAIKAKSTRITSKNAAETVIIFTSIFIFSLLQYII